MVPWLSKNMLRPLANDLFLFTALGLLLFWPGAQASASDLERAKGVAPPNHAILSDTLSGSYFVAAPLKEQYDRLLAQLETLKRELDLERVTGPQAAERLRSLRQQFHELRQTIERTKVLVPVAKVHSSRVTLVFELGAERSLIITADQVKLTASPDGKVHCTLERIFLGVDDQSAEGELAARKSAAEELAAIKIVHQHGPVPEIVGQTSREWQADERRFLDSPAGRALTPDQLAGRRQFIDSIQKSYALYRNVQGKSIDTLAVTGLTYEQGNRQIILEAESKGGTKASRSQWRRHASLTVAVPKCQTLIVRGSLRGLEVQGIPTSLILTSSGSRDRDYQAQFRIQGVHGNLTVVDFPVNLIEDVDGDVTIDAPRDFANSGTHHGSNGRQAFWYPPLECRCARIRDSLQAHFGRVSLHLQDIHGRMDVHNDFGDTTWTISQPLPESSRRVTSQSGRVEVQAAPAALGQLPIVLATNYGTVRTDAHDSQLAEFHLGTTEGGGRDWTGFRSQTANSPNGPAADTLGLIDVLQGKTNPPGLVVVSRAGTVEFNMQSQQ